MPFKISYFQKNFLYAMSVLGYLTKLKRGIGLTLGVHFLHDFFHQNILYLILYQWTKFQCHTLFLSQDIKQNVLLSPYLNKWWHYFDFDFNESTSKVMANREKKRGKTKIQKFEYCETKKSFLDRIKKHFSSFLKGYHLVKNKNLIKNSQQKF